MRDSRGNVYLPSDKKSIFAEKCLLFSQACWDLTGTFPPWLTYDAAVSSLYVWSSSGHNYYIGHPAATKNVDQMCSCCSNRAMTAVLFKTSSLALPGFLFIYTLPAIFFQPVEFLLRQHLQKFLHIWLHLLNMSPGKGNQLQSPREEFDTQPVRTCSDMNSSLHPHMQTHSCTTSKPDNLPGSPSSKDRII